MNHTQNNYRDSVHRPNWVMIGLFIITAAACIGAFLRSYP